MCRKKKTSLLKFMIVVDFQRSIAFRFNFIRSHCVELNELLVEWYIRDCNYIYF